MVVVRWREIAAAQAASGVHHGAGLAVGVGVLPPVTGGATARRRSLEALIREWI
jgi:hypothetical protein